MQAQQRFGSTLVLAETHEGTVTPETLSAIQAGTELGDVTVLVCGDDSAVRCCETVLSFCSSFPSSRRTLCCGSSGDPLR